MLNLNVPWYIQFSAWTLRLSDLFWVLFYDAPNNWYMLSLACKCWAGPLVLYVVRKGERKFCLKFLEFLKHLLSGVGICLSIPSMILSAYGVYIGNLLYELRFEKQLTFDLIDPSQLYLNWILIAPILCYVFSLLAFVLSLASFATVFLRSRRFIPSVQSSIRR